MSHPQPQARPIDRSNYPTTRLLEAGPLEVPEASSAAAQAQRSTQRGSSRAGRSPHRARRPAAGGNHPRPPLRRPGPQAAAGTERTHDKPRSPPPHRRPGASGALWRGDVRCVLDLLKSLDACIARVFLCMHEALLCPQPYPACTAKPPDLFPSGCRGPMQLTAPTSLLRCTYTAWC
jgi:hypothetical protein